MLLKFTNHCQLRILERKINTDHIKKAIREPDTRKNISEGKIQVNKKIGNKIIEVICYKDGFKDKKEEYIIVTAYYLDK